MPVRIPIPYKTSQTNATRVRSRLARDEAPPIRTMGEVFPDGEGIELLHDAATGRLTLLLFDGKKRCVAPRHETRGNAYLPAEIEPSFLQAITLPSTCTDYGSTLELFTAVRAPFSTYGFTEEVASPAAFFVFASWFPDCLPAAPYLCIAGPRPEAGLLLQLLACMVRHPLRLGEITRSALCSLPFDLQLTLLIDHEPTSRSAQSLLAASNERGAFIWGRGRLISPFSAKAVYRGPALNDGNLDSAPLQINVLPIRGRLPILDMTAQREIVENLQPMMQDYRCRNISKVCESSMDFPEFQSELRILGRVLGAGIVDAPALQADLEPLLRRFDELARAERWRDLRCVTIEALLFLTHSEKQIKVHVGKITQTLSTILKGRGESVSLEPETIGRIVRVLGFTPKRDSKGKAIHLSDRVRRRIHELARAYDVAAVQEGMALCQLCREILPASGCKAKVSNSVGFE
jgi:hypothetical protein